MASESAMNHAGRTSSHPYRDLRSASRAKQRTRAHLQKYNHLRRLSRADLPTSPQQTHYPPVWPYHGTADGHCLSASAADLSNAPIADFTKRETYVEAQWSQPVTKHHSRAKNDSPKLAKRRHRRKDVDKEIASREWWNELWWKEHLDDWLPSMDEISRYQDFGDMAEVFETWEEYTEVGETFTSWCQRRLREMRQVNEARIIAQQQPPSTPSPSSNAGDEDEDEDEGYASTASTPSPSPLPLTTTVPTSPGDKRGHREIEMFVKLGYVRRPYRWFDEYAWYWHRNWTGCWFVLGDECGECAPYLGCCCKAFAKDEKDPEGPQACSLVEWVKGELYDILCDEAREQGEVYGEEQSEGWEVLSITSEAWTEVEEDFEFDVV